LKHVASLHYGDALAQETRADGPVPVFGSNGVAGSHDRANTGAPAIIVGRKGSYGKVTWTDVPGFCIDTAYYVDAGSTNSNLRWLFYALQTLSLDMHSEDTGVPGLSREKAYQCKLRLPSVGEQERIANFLDEQTARIDALIAEKKRLAEAVAEFRASRMRELVCHGLSPSSSTETHVTWLGHISSEWEVARIKHVARLESGHTPDKKVPAYWEDCDIPWVSLNDTAQLLTVDYISETAFSVNKLGIENSSARLLPPGTVFFSRDATIGRCGIASRTMACSQHFIGWVCGPKVLPEYLLFVLRSMTDELDRMTMGATLKTIGMDDVKRLWIPLPPIAEQHLIVEQIRAMRERTSALEGVARAFLIRLAEYRASLISAAVTGQLDINSYKEAA
jgi:type I restriction enzyme S subunit